ncbi:nitrilase-related carbon-nitrogen hydrolase [Candidatus Methylopumilus planktonicus]|uniref:nitrilase-related carbon-nitrogen hydrolase n=1 Tax=Candidatus Methylopumilus planktonicus TaxID=1581557 RepID=UPI003BEED0A3
MKIALVSLNQKWEDKSANLLSCKYLTEKAKLLGAELIIFPEMTLTGFSMNTLYSEEPAEIAQLVQEAERAWQAMGQINYGATKAEKKSLVFKCSLYIVKDLKAGDELTSDNVRAFMPGLGLATKYLDVVLGKSVNQDIKRGTALDWALFE